jgi:hypothetical protein
MVERVLIAGGAGFIAVIGTGFRGALLVQLAAGARA